jgi:dGTPase
VGEGTPNALQKSLLKKVKQGETVGIEALLESVATSNKTRNKVVSLQDAAVELFDALQWGRLQLTGAAVTKPEEQGDQPDPQLPQLEYLGDDLRAERNKRAQEESHASGVRRSESRIDRDRILQSWAFRRLEGVTQIVTPDQSGHLMHSRLTHSMKVGQVARRIADELLLKCDRDGKKPLLIPGGGLDPDVVEAAGFAHDMGHPPFGHAGEKVLDAWARDHGLLDGFEGNAQSLRVVTQLEFRFPHVLGMNLTNATQAAIIKYPWKRGKDGTKWEKYNAYNVDYKDHLTKPRDSLGVHGEAQTLEASIMDIADDITYALHDLEDFYTAGLFPRNQAAAVLEDYSNKVKKISNKPPTTHQYEEVEKCAEKLAEKREKDYNPDLFNKAVDKVHALIRFSMYRHFDGSRDAFTLIRTAFASLIDSYIAAIWLENGTDDEGNDWAVARLDEEHWYEIELLKWLTRQFVHNRAELALTQLGQGRLLWETLDRLFRWSQDKPFDGLPKKNTAVKLDPNLPIVLAGMIEKTSDRQKARAVVDYVASLTDAQVASLARALSGSDRPSSLYFP